MLVSVIVPTYKDTQALKLILDALQLQTYKNFEVIIAEDNDSDEVKSFLNNYSCEFEIKHLFHEDNGNRKAVIMNKALLHVRGEYIIFIDGDTIPYTTFIESHVALSEPKTILCGRRVNLGDKVSSDLREGKISAYELEKKFLKYYSYIKNDNSRHYEQGLRLKPRSLLYTIISKLNKNVHILGSNFSCYKREIYAINGFDEDIIGGSKDDVDLEWRFVANGCQLKSCKYCANLFHLNHARNSRTQEIHIAAQQMDKNRLANKFVCDNGIEKHD